MKKFLSILLVVAIAACVTAPVYASMGEKFQGGIKTAFKSPLQVKDGVVEGWNDAKFKPIGAAGGLLKGLFYMGKDLVTGLFDAATFFINSDK